MDYFNMMTYDFNGGFSDIAGHRRGVITQGQAALNAPLVKRQETVDPDGLIETGSDFDHWPRPMARSLLRRPLKVSRSRTDTDKGPRKTGPFILDLW